MSEGLEGHIARYSTAAAERSIGYPLPAELRSVVRSLDKQFWAEVTRRTLAAAGAGTPRLVFSGADQLLIDTGLIDRRLVPGADDAFANRLSAEIVEAHPNVYYLSGWLAARYRQEVSLKELATEDTRPINETPELIYVRLARARSKILAQLAPLFDDLAGVSEEMAGLITGGKIDREIERLSELLLDHDDDEAAARRDQYVGFRDRALAQLRARTRRPSDVLQIERLEQINAQVVLTLKARARAAAESPPEFGLAPAEGEAFLRREIRLVRSALQLGTTDAGIRRTHSVLLSAEDRLVPSRVAALFTLAREADPALPEDLRILIAPYTGAAFYAWDRRAVVVPLRALRDPDEAVVGGFASYRMMTDMLRDGGQLMAEYTAAAAGRRSGNVRDAFIRDYRQWVLRVAQGFRGALEGRMYELFKRRVGPPADSIVIPRDLQNLSQGDILELLKSCRRQVNAGSGAWTDYYRLGIAYYLRENLQDAYQNLLAAQSLEPRKGMLLFSLGVLGYKLDIPSWRQYFQSCSTLAPSSIWHVYAAEYLSEG